MATSMAARPSVSDTEPLEGTGPAKVHLPAAWTSRAAADLGASISGGWQQTVATDTLHWDYITDGSKRIYTARTSVGRIHL